MQFSLDHPVTDQTRLTELPAILAGTHLPSPISLFDALTHPAKITAALADKKPEGVITVGQFRDFLKNSSHQDKKEFSGLSALLLLNEAGIRGDAIQGIGKFTRAVLKDNGHVIEEHAPRIVNHHVDYFKMAAMNRAAWTKIIGMWETSRLASQPLPLMNTVRESARLGL